MQENKEVYKLNPDFYSSYGADESENPASSNLLMKLLGLVLLAVVGYFIYTLVDKRMKAKTSVPSNTVVEEQQLVKPVVENEIIVQRPEKQESVQEVATQPYELNKEDISHIVTDVMSQIDEKQELENKKEEATRNKKIALEKELREKQALEIAQLKKAAKIKELALEESLRKERALAKQAVVKEVRVKHVDIVRNPTSTNGTFNDNELSLEYINMVKQALAN